MESRLIETNEVPKKESWEKTLSILEWSALGMFIVFLLVYFSKGILSLFGVQLTHKLFLHETWGVLGDFVGGVLGTFIAYISVRLLVKTLYHQISHRYSTFLPPLILSKL
jgi:positive regulator of sigma E activity